MYFDTMTSEEQVSYLIKPILEGSKVGRRPDGTFGDSRLYL